MYRSYHTIERNACSIDVRIKYTFEAGHGAYRGLQTYTCTNYLYVDSVEVICMHGHNYSIDYLGDWQDIADAWALEHVLNELDESDHLYSILMEKAL